MPLLPTSELEAVNEMLRAIGESPVNSLDTPGVVDAVTARSTLASVSRRVQTRGWYFNTETRTLAPQAFAPKHILVPSNTVKADTTDEDEHLNVTLRGVKLYDLDNNTYQFTRALKVRLVLLLPFDELPEAARSFITSTAAMEFQQDSMGSESLATFHQQRAGQAWAELRKADSDQADRNILRAPGASRVLMRGFGGGWR